MPGSDLDASEADFDQALAVDIKDVDTWIGRGRTRSVRAFHRLDQGQDATNDLAAAEADLTQALALKPRKEALEFRGELRSRRAAARSPSDAKGASGDYAAAEADFLAFLQGESGHAWGRLRWAALHRRRGSSWLRAGQSPGQDPMSDWRLAAAELDRAQVELGGLADLWLERARLSLARAGLLRGRERQKAMKQARGEADRALVIDPRFFEAVTLRRQIEN